MSYNYTSADPNEWVMGCIRGYYIRYDQLAGLINANFQGSAATCVDIFIDMTDIMKTLDGFLSSNQGVINDGLVVASGIINMVAHYRRFFLTRYQCKTRFWIIASMSGEVQKLHFAKFQPPADKLSPSTRSLYTDNLSLMDMICKNIPDVQVEVCNCEFVTKALQIHEWEQSPNPLFCITKDPFAFQICGSKVPAFVLRPKKNKGLDVSYIIGRGNCISSYITELSKKTNPQSAWVISFDEIAMLMAMTRVPSRGLSTLYQLNTGIKKLSEMSVRGYPYDLDFFLEKLSVTSGGMKDPYILSNRFKACDACYIQLEGYKTSMEARLYNGMVNLYDPAGVKNINNQYFKKYPLDLDSL